MSKRRHVWAFDYVKAIVQRDVREIAEVEKLYQMPHLLRVLANHSGQLTNFNQIGGQICFDDKTTRKYVGILVQLFLVRRLEPWLESVETLGQDTQAAIPGFWVAQRIVGSHDRTSFARAFDIWKVIRNICLG